MHVDSIRPARPSSAPATDTPQPWRTARLMLATAALGLLPIGQVAAQTSAPANSPEAQEAAPPAKQGKPVRICEYEDITGSRMKKRICLTPEQWEARQKAAKDFTRELDAKPVAKDGDEG
ncbi:hypothetical protein [Stenotrophomonas sp. PS02297]|uniref:hypothetical protein n=1 Tax=Stenotrophomonas sp. PS02297 TaxID=2991423 RepID=UPI00249C0915|nr:hypothetical protein [Stenotrophomonas sp. PS02297]